MAGGFGTDAAPNPSANRYIEIAASGAAERSGTTTFPLFSLFAFILMLVLLPIRLGELLATSLSKLHLNPDRQRGC